LVSQKNWPIQVHAPKWHRQSKAFGRGEFHLLRRIIECHLCHGHWL
jgi:hypothetical protein